MNIRFKSLVLISILFISAFFIDKEILSAIKDDSEPMSVKSFVFKLIEKMKLENKLDENIKYKNALKILPSPIKEKLIKFKKNDIVHRSLIVEILAPYLKTQDLKEIYVNSNNIIFTTEILEVLNKCNFDNKIFSPIYPQEHTFDNHFERQLKDISKPSDARVKQMNLESFDDIKQNVIQVASISNKKNNEPTISGE